MYVLFIIVNVWLGSILAFIMVIDKPSQVNFFTPKMEYFFFSSPFTLTIHYKKADCHRFPPTRGNL